MLGVFLTLFCLPQICLLPFKPQILAHYSLLSFNTINQWGQIWEAKFQTALSLHTEKSRGFFFFFLCSHSYAISVVLVCSIATSILLSFFWDFELKFHRQSYSFGILVLCFFGGCVGCSSVVIFYPFASMYKPLLISAVSVGGGEYWVLASFSLLLLLLLLSYSSSILLLLWHSSLLLFLLYSSLLFPSLLSSPLLLLLLSPSLSYSSPLLSSPYFSFFQISPLLLFSPRSLIIAAANALIASGLGAIQNPGQTQMRIFFSFFFFGSFQ